MGIKRPFTEEDIQVSSFKQAKQLDFCRQQTSYTEAFSSDEVSHTADNRGEAVDSFDNYQLLKGLGHVDLCSSSSLAEKELESSAPLSWVTSSSSEEDAGSGEAPFLFNVFPEFFEFNFPRRVVGQFENDYSSLMSCSPRKQIPIGPNHQAEIPPWDPQAIGSDSLSPTSCIDDNEQRIGTCIISTSLSNYSAPEDVKIGQGRIDCDCLDGGSVRCVRQHVNEAREKLREVIGDKKFADMGFYEMGEEVAAKWTEEEEFVFHKVVYSNPVSLGRNFWRQLPVVFHSRTSKDLVSYYFNVFMLRRRAVQNRSNLLEIDSDDDEWKANDGGIFRVVGDDEDSVVESFGDQDVNEGSEDDIPFDIEVDAGDSDDDDGDDGEVGINGDMEAGREDSKGRDDLSGQILKSQIECLHNDFSSNNLPSMLNPTNTREHQNGQEESSTSSESQLCIGPSCVSFGVGRDTQESVLKSDFNGCLGGESNGSSDGLESEFLLEPSGAKVWDESCSTVLTKGVDLLPTCNMIEEIFGPFTSKSK